MKVPLLDLKAQYAAIRSEVERAVGELFAAQQFVLGPVVDRFEGEMSAYTGARHAIGVASGSDALLLALMALEVGPGDTVVTTPFTFFATAGSIARTGARLVFADIDPGTFNLSSATVAPVLEACARESRRTVLMPVHLYGRVAPMEELGALAERLGARVVEDAAQSVGARQRLDGAARMSGTMGDLGALSFFPSKNLGAAGDAGMVLTNDESLATRVRLLRTHGQVRRYVHDFVGINSRLDSLQAALLSVKLRYVEGWNARRRERAAAYSSAFRAARPAPSPIVLPEPAGEEHVFHQYVIRCPLRDELRSALSEAGIETQIYYPIPLHLQPCFEQLGLGRGSFPEAERAADECLALPIYPELRDEQIDFVVGAIGDFYRRG